MEISGERNLASSQTQCYYDYNKYKSNQEARKMANKENKNVKELNWAVLGTGVIANEMAQALQKMGKSLYEVGNRTHQKAVEFAAKYGISKVYDCIDDMFEDENTDIIYLT